MINAAEPVDCYALQQFRLFFSKYNLSPSIIYPTYGLAEHTVFVCSGGKQILYVTKSSLEGRKVEVVADYKNYDEVPSLENSKEGSQIDLQRHLLVVGCGFPDRGEGVVLKIVDPDTGNILQDDDMVCDLYPLFSPPSSRHRLVKSGSPLLPKRLAIGIVQRSLNRIFMLSPLNIQILILSFALVTLVSFMRKNYLFVDELKISLLSGVAIIIHKILNELLSKTIH